MRSFVFCVVLLVFLVPRTSRAADCAAIDARALARSAVRVEAFEHYAFGVGEPTLVAVDFRVVEVDRPSDGDALVTESPLVS